ncbi:hypothetical protein SAMN02910456_00480 [Ruminococcaceae bacterium YRB3002]|nr:hypothetical protein SAMN02910456_00480 [Ruminococcaceae bacterium YRB3002]
MRHKLSLIYLIAAAVINIPLILFELLNILIFTVRYEPGYLLMVALFLTAQCLYLAINIVSILRLWKENKRVVASSLLMKTTVFLLFFASLYITPKVFIPEATLCFGILAAVVGTAVFFFCRSRAGGQDNKPVKSNGIDPRLSGFTDYKAKWVWADAAAEYKRIHGTEVSADMNYQVYRYASMPVIYLFQWLRDRELLTDEINDSLRYAGGDVLDQFRVVMDYCLLRNEIRPGILKFLDSYCAEANIFRPGMDHFMFDYYEAVRNPDKAYYCVEYSEDTYNRLASVIDDRYSAFRSSLSNEDPPVYESVDRVKWDLTGDELSVTAVGNVSRSYISLCGAALNSIPVSRLDKLARIFQGWSLESFHPDMMIIHEPKGDEAAFIVSGKADLGQECGISFAVRDGVIVAGYYSYCRYSPWDPELNDRFELAKDDKDLYHLDSELRLNEMVRSGDLVPVMINGAEVYVTPAAARIRERMESRCEAIMTQYRDCRVEERTDMRAGSLIPRSDCITLSIGKETKFLYIINIWE